MFDDWLYRVSRSESTRRVLTPLARSYLRYCPGRAGKEAFWNRVVNPYLAWEPYRFVASTIFGCRLAGNTRDMIQQYIYYFGVWEPELTDWISHHLAPGDGFIDVGANIGYYTLLASALVGDSGQVTAIEASPVIYQQLRANLERNRVTNVRALNVAASDHAGRLPLFRGPEHNSGETSLFQSPGSEPGGTIEAAPLSTILETTEVSRMRLLKVDVEGAEGAVIPGLMPLLKSTRQDVQLVIEFHPQYLTTPGKRAEDLINLICSAGFAPYRLRNEYWPLNYRKQDRANAPERFTGTIEGETVVIFSREDLAKG